MYCFKQQIVLNDPSNCVIERATYANLRSHSDSFASNAHNLCSKTSEIMQILFKQYHLLHRNNSHTEKINLIISTGNKLFFLLLDYSLRFFVTPITYLTLRLICSMRVLNSKFVITNFFPVSATFMAYFTVTQCGKLWIKNGILYLDMFFGIFCCCFSRTPTIQKWESDDHKLLI